MANLREKPASNLVGQAYIEHISNEALRALRLNYEHQTDFVNNALSDLANVEADTMRKYRGRYVFEMLQNANDAILEGKFKLNQEQSVFRVRIHLTQDALIVANDGAPFAEKDVNSIVRWGESSKTNTGASGYKTIGYKGIGFKSVLEITGSPQILSGIVQFHFDRETCDAAIQKITKKRNNPKLPYSRFIFPFSIEQITGTDKTIISRLIEEEHFSTVIRLPLKEGVTSEQVLAQIMTDIDPALLIFLEGIDEIDVWHGSDRLLIYSRKCTTETGKLGKEIILSEGLEVVSRWLYFDSPKIDVRDRSLISDLHEDAWQQVKQIGFALAFPLDENNHLRIEDTESNHLYVYFPTEEHSNLRYRIHADFYVDSSRKEIDHKIRYNVWLSEQIAEFLAHSVAPGLISRFPNDERVVEILSPTSTPNDIAEMLHRAIMKELETCVFIPAQDGKYTSPRQALLAPRALWNNLADFWHFFPYAELSRKNKRKLFIRDELYSSPSVIDFIERLGATFIEPSSVFQLLDGRDPTAGRKDYTIFFNLLYNWRELVGGTIDQSLTNNARYVDYAKRNFDSSLSNSFCILDTSGHWVKPSEKLYHPKFRQDMDEMLSIFTIKFVDPVIYGSDGRNSSAYDVLGHLNPPVNDYDAREIIINEILPLFENGKFQDLKSLHRAQVYRFIFEYWEKSRNSSALNDLVGKVQVYAQSISNRRHQEWRYISEVYLSGRWTGDPYLEQIYSGFDGIYFLYEIRDLNIQEQERGKWCNFFQFLGGHITPRVIDHEKSYWSWNALNSNHPHRQSAYWQEYTRFIEDTFGTCQRHGRSCRVIRKSIIFEGLDLIIQTQDYSRLISLFKLLTKNWGALKQIVDSKVLVECTKRNCLISYRTEWVPNFVSYLLTHAKWIPARAIETIGPALLRPKSCWVIPASEDSIVQTMLPGLAQEIERSGNQYQQFCQNLGMHFLQNASVDDLVQILRELPDRFPDPAFSITIGRRSYPRAVRSITRWVFERIYNTLSQLKQNIVVQSRDFPLIADQGENILYVQPGELIFFDDDHTIGLRWRKDVPFAPLDNNWLTIATLLGIPSISTSVVETFEPGQVLKEKSEALYRRFVTARPYLLAIFDSRRAARSDDAVRHLLNLEINVVDRLVVKRALKGVTELSIPDDNAQIFLQERTLERSGSAGRAPKAGTIFIVVGQHENFDLLGAPIATYLDILALSDAYVIILDRGGKDGRMNYLSTLGISEDRVQDMRRRLGQPSDEPPPVEIYKNKVRLGVVPGITGGPDVESGDVLVDPNIGPTVPPFTPPSPPVEPPDPPPPSPPPGGPIEIVLPNLDFDDLVPTIVEGNVILVSPPTVTGGGGSGGGGGRGGIQDYILKQIYGERGEEVVCRQEIERLRKLGVENPEKHVVWLRKNNRPYADHDFESKDRVNGEWITIYIEVKSTSGNDFRFEMSSSELDFADKHGESYRLHRVIDITSPRPQVFIFGNPMMLYRRGNALIDMRDTYVTLPDPTRQV